MSLNEYLNKIETYLRNMITNLLNSDAWIIKSTIAINIFFSKGTEEERTMYLNSDNIKFTSYSEVNEVANELFKPLLSKYQEHLEISKKWSDFIFDSVHLKYYMCHKVNCKRGGSYIDSPDWIKKKKATINPKNEDEKSFQLLH